jgi:DnaJ-domain-containing protein 1
MTALAEKFKQAYQSDELDGAREIVRKLQFMNKAKNEIDELTATIEDELI